MCKSCGVFKEVRLTPFLVDNSANFIAGLVKVSDAVLSLQERPMPSEPVKSSTTRPSN